MADPNPQSYKRKVKKNMDRKGRFRTQPITFMEIKVTKERNAAELFKVDSRNLSIPGSR